MAEGTKKPLPPLILGIVTARMLAARRYPPTAWECGGVELRADGLPGKDVIPALASFAAEKARRNFTGPIIFTLRLRRDGGVWEDGRSREREPLWRALAVRSRQSAPLCDLLDIEIEEAGFLSPEVRGELWGSGVKVMLSHHDFVPNGIAIWEKNLAAMRDFHPHAVKFAVTPGSAGEVALLLWFARRVSDEFPLSCAMGMGEMGRGTRVVSPLLGCPITYAFLEDGPVAPGQLALPVLRACLAQAEGRPALEAPDEQWMDWARRAIREHHHAA